MQRRKLLLGMGTAAGAAGAVGSGAFTSVRAQRDVSVQVADDSDALLSLEPGTGPNANAFATVSDGTVGLDFSSTDTGGSGLGTDSTYRFDGLLQVRNQGTQSIFLFVRVSGGVSNDELYFYPDSDPTVQLRDRANEVVELTPGEAQTVGAFVDTSALESDVTATATFNATAERPDESFTAGETPQDAVLVSRQSGRGDFDDIQPAVDAIQDGSVQKSAIQVDPGRYATDGPVVVGDVTDLRLRGDGSGNDPGSNTVLEDQVEVRGGADSVTLQDLRVTGAEGGNSDTGDGVFTVGTTNSVSAVTLENVAVVDNRQAGLSLQSVERLDVRNSVIDGNGGSGIDASGISGRIEFTRIRNNGGSGVDVDDFGGGSELELYDVLVEGNERLGVDVFGDDVGSVTVSESVIDDNGGTGLAVGTGYADGQISAVEVTGVSVSDNGDSGLIVFGDSASDVTVQNVEASNNGANGIDLNGVAFDTPVVERVTADGNDGTGVVLGNQFAGAVAKGQIRRASVDGNGGAGGFSGVAVFDGAATGTNVAVSNSNVIDNAGFGVSTDDTDGGTEVQLSNVFLDDNGTGTSQGVAGGTAGAPVSGVGADGN
ncbi:right-handed parallel beta-helix repeat-containing protein [Halobaculum sp. MBLA0143]|uniref:right-handed parallel beta-helix repeat-containing protein n=1 Tax=Halobaculum sp. MBLA0143 TaxID=3079933 RepID=UPI003524CE47